MTNRVSTKRALVLSLLSMLLCVSMLIGSTYAWFTDTATTAVNKIQAGTLDVALEMSTDNGATWTKAEGKTLNFMTADNHEEILWEPGCTYALPLLRVVNKGNLSLKYEIVITGIDGDAELNKAIEWTIPAEKTGNLAAGATSDAIAISGHMKETAGNEYQGKSIDGIAITVYATQYTGESDSNGNTYDENAPIVYPEGVTAESFGSNVAADGEGNYFASFKAAMESVADKGALYFKADATVDFPTHLDVTKNVTIYANGANFSGKDISIGTYAAPANAETTVNIYNAKNLVVWGQPVGDRADVWNVNFYDCVNEGYNFLMYRGGETAVAKLNLTMTNCRATGYTDSTVHATADGSITIKNCLFIGNIAPINIAHKQSGTMTVTVEDSTFSACGTVDTENQRNEYCAPARFVNNSATGTLKVTLKNNTFVGTIGTNGDILLGDYRVGKESNPFTATIVTDQAVMVKSSVAPAYSYNGGTVDVKKADVKASQEAVEDAIKQPGEKTIDLAAGTYTFYGVEGAQTTGTTLTIQGSGKDSTTFTAGDLTVTDANGEGSSDYSYENSEVIFRNMTINVGTGNYKGFVRAKSLYFENCKIVGRGSYWGVGDVVFKNCVFAENENDYNLWTYAGTNFTFDGCEFYSSVGKFINAYKEQRVDSKLTFTKCKFIYTGNGTASKPAVCLKSYTGIAWDVTFTDCTSNAKTDNGTGSNLYSIESGMNADTTVVINGVTVWENGAKK